MMIAWDYPLLSDSPVLTIVYVVLIFGVLGALFGAMAGLVQWSVLRSRSTAAFPGRMILISAVAGATGAIAQPLVNIGLLVFLFNVIKTIPRGVCFTIATLASIAAMGAVYGAVMATASNGLSSPRSGSESDVTSEFLGSRPRLPRNW